MLLLSFIVEMLVKLWIEDPLSSESSASIMQCYLFMNGRLCIILYIFFSQMKMDPWLKHHIRDMRVDIQVHKGNRVTWVHLG